MRAAHDRIHTLGLIANRDTSCYVDMIAIALFKPHAVNVCGGAAGVIGAAADTDLV